MNPSQVTNENARSWHFDEVGLAGFEPTILAGYFDQAREGLQRLEREPAQWREHTGTNDETLWLTAPELAALQAEQDKLLEAYRGRRRDPASRPAGARRISVIQIVIPVDGGPE